MEKIQITQACIDIINKILTSGAAITAAVVAIIGLKTWKKQLKGKTDYEIARSYLKQVYKIREAIKDIRHPAMWAEEISEAEKKYGLENKDKPMWSSEAVYRARFEKLSDAFSDLYVTMFEAEISWGMQARDIALDLTKCAHKLRREISKYLSEKTDPLNIDNEIVFDNLNENDKFSIEVNTAISSIEKYLKPHLE